MDLLGDLGRQSVSQAIHDAPRFRLSTSRNLDDVYLVDLLEKTDRVPAYPGNSPKRDEPGLQAIENHHVGTKGWRWGLVGVMLLT
jgi:hypothetical protein